MYQPVFAAFDHLTMLEENIAAYSTALQPPPTLMPQTNLNDPIMDLPLELREIIYEYALAQQEPVSYISTYGSFRTLTYFPIKESTNYRYLKPQKFLPALLYASPQYRSDALPCFLRANTIRLTADFHVDGLITWLTAVNGFGHIRSLELPYFNHSHLGFSAHKLLVQCPLLANLTMNLSQDRLMETREVTGWSNDARFHHAMYNDENLRAPREEDEDIFVALEIVPQVLNWKVKLERIKALPSLKYLTLCLAGKVDYKEVELDLQRLKEWFDEGFNGRVVVRTERKDEPLTEINCSGRKTKK